MFGTYRRLSVSVLLSAGLLWSCWPPLPAGAEEPPAPPPADACVLEIHVVEGVQIEVDGKAHGDQRRIRFEQLDAKTIYQSRVRATFPNGKTAERKVLIYGGRVVHLDIADPDLVQPTTVLQTAHTDSVTAIAFAADGQTFVSGSEDNTAILWRTTGKKLHTFSLDGEPNSAEFSQDGNRLMTATASRLVIWDLATRTVVKSFEREQIKAASLSADGDRVAVKCGVTAEVLSVDTGRTLQTFTVQYWAYTKGIAISPDGKLVVYQGKPKQAVVYSTETGQALKMLELPTTMLRRVCFSRDGTTCALATSKGLNVYAVDGWKLVATFEADHWIEGLGLSSSGKIAATVVKGGKAILWDVVTQRQVGTLNLRGGSGLNDHYPLAFSPIDQTLIAGIADGGATLFSVPDCTPLRYYGFHTVRTVPQTFDPSDQQLLVGRNYDEIRLWSLDQGRPVRLFPQAGYWPEAKFINRDRGVIAFGSAEHSSATAITWDIADVNLRKQVTVRRDYFPSALSPDGKWILTTPEARQPLFALWTATGEKVHTLNLGGMLKDDYESIDKAMFTEDSQRVVLISDKRAFIYSTEDGKMLKQFSISGVFSWGDAFALSSDPLLLFAPVENEIRAWSLETGRLMHRFSYGKQVNWSALAVSEDSRFMASVSEDGVTLWSCASQRKLWTAPIKTRIERLVFSPDARTIAVGCERAGLRLLDVATGEEKARLYEFHGSPDWLVTTPSGLFDGSELGRNLVSYQVPGVAMPAPVDRFFQDFYRPGLLAQVLRNEQRLPDVQLAGETPPLLRLVSPPAAEVVEDSSLKLRLEIKERGGGLAGPFVFHNGARILVPPAKTEADASIVEFTVALVEGENRLEFRAASASGVWESEPVACAVRYERRLDKPPQLLVVAIGIDGYAEESLRLKFARSDARAIGQLFESRGPALYQKVNLIRLEDEQATRANIAAALERAAKASQPQDTFVLFLAGHGVTLGERYYFLPQDFRRDEALGLEENIRRQGIAEDVLADQIVANRALRRVLIYDTCQSGGALAGVANERTPFALHGAIERLSHNHGVFAIAAASMRENAKEIAELKHGVLTYSLLAGLNGLESDAPPLVTGALRPGSDGVVDVMEWFTYAQGQVGDLTKKYQGFRQDVVFKASGKSFPLLPLDALPRSAPPR